MKLEFPKFLTCQGFSLGNFRRRLAYLPEKSLGKLKIWETQA
jgi:hypothetical protein